MLRAREIPRSFTGPLDRERKGWATSATLWFATTESAWLEGSEAGPWQELRESLVRDGSPVFHGAIIFEHVESLLGRISH